MNPQQVPQAPTQKPKNKLQSGVSFITRWVIKGISIAGKENYTKIPENAVVIFAVAALTADIEVFCAAQEISSDWDVVIATHMQPQTFLEQGLLTIAQFITGPNTFFSLPKATSETDVFFSHPEKYYGMLSQMKNHKQVVMAATGLSSDGVLPKDPSLEPVYLAQLAKDACTDRTVVIVPVVTELQTGPVRTAQITIGSPIAPPHVDVRAITSVLQKKPTERIPQDYETAKQIALALRQQGSIVTQALSLLLPPEKRGIWGETAVSSAK